MCKNRKSANMVYVQEIHSVNFFSDYPKLKTPLASHSITFTLNLVSPLILLFLKGLLVLKIAWSVYIKVQISVHVPLICRPSSIQCFWNRTLIYILSNHPSYSDYVVYRPKFENYLACLISAISNTTSSFASNLFSKNLLEGTLFLLR